MAQDAVIALQSPSNTPVTPGARTVIVTVPIKGVPTQVQMQAISISDANGVVIDFGSQAIWQSEVLHELRELRKLCARFMGEYQSIPDVAVPLSDVAG